VAIQVLAYVRVGTQIYLDPFVARAGLESKSRDEHVVIGPEAVSQRVRDLYPQQHRMAASGGGCMVVPSCMVWGMLWL
jgi:hypothetical protein